MQLSDFDFHLPPELIARYPLPTRASSKLLCLDGQSGALDHKKFLDLSEIISPLDLLIFNDTRVIPARLIGYKETGGKVEILVERFLGQQRVLVHAKASKSLKVGMRLNFAEAVQFTVLSRQQDLYELECLSQTPVLSLVERIGQIPLPPYFGREAEASDVERYQTVYAKFKGSVAAPTAGLHFDQAFLEVLRAKGIDFAYLTLHVGAGTFAPVRVDNILEHRMHPEAIHISADLCAKVQAAKQRGGRVIAVGTTSLRSLESASRSGTLQSYTGDTDIFIYPGFTFNCVDALITNLHTPRSTLLMLISAFAGYENVMYAYQVAVAEKYRFFSYGDAMFLTRS